MVPLWLAFFCSGMAGLAYELTWVRYLTQLFGASTPAVSATVSIFFTGLALGAALGGRLFDRVRFPLVVYAALELMIGVCAAIVPLLFRWAEVILAERLHQGTESPLLLLFVSAIILLLPTSLLGATFPAMAAVVRHLDNPTYSTGFFYGFNTLGAVVGCLFVSFVLLPSFGQQQTTWIMACANLFIAVLLWGLYHWLRLDLGARVRRVLGGHGWEATSVEEPECVVECVERPLSELRPASSYSGVSFQAVGLAALETEPQLLAVPVSTTLSPHVSDIRTESQPMPAVIVEGAIELETTSLRRALSSRVAFILAGASGFLAIGIEVLWTRALALAFPASSHVFALVLAAYLVGIGVGSVGVGAIFRRHHARRIHLLLLYLMIGAGSVLTLLFFPRLMPWLESVLARGWFSSWTAHMGWIGAAAVLAMLPATLAMGAALPILIGLATRSEEDTSTTAGRIYAINTIGGVLGSFFVTFSLLPWLGLGQSLFLLALGYGGIALLLAGRAHPLLRWGTPALVAVGAGLLLLGIYPDANPLRHRPKQTLLFYQETPAATLAVYASPQRYRSLYINNRKGFRDTRPETVLMQYRVGHLSALLHPQPRRLLLLGFGTGATLAAISVHAIPRVDCIELHGGRLQALAPMFTQANLNMPWRTPKQGQTIRVQADDGRRVLLRPGPRYDIIAESLFAPQSPGISALYSLEQFRAARKRLSDQGVFVVWLPLHRLDPRALAAITKTFLRAFPKAEGWVASWDPQAPVLGLVGRRDGLPMMPSSQLSQRFLLQMRQTLRAYQQQLGRSTGQRPLYAVSTQRRLLTAPMLQRLAVDAPINRLEQPVVEFLALRTLLQKQLRHHSLLRRHLRRFALVRSLHRTPWNESTIHHSQPTSWHP